MRRIRDLVETADQTEAEEVHKLGSRLFFDRNGPIDVYGSEEALFGKPTSPNEEPVGQDDPAILVNKLELSAKGCEWLRDQWEQLKAPLLEPEGCWVGCHRLMAVRLLGRQPVNAVRDRLVAEVFVASFALKEDRSHEFSELLYSDLSEGRWQNLTLSAMLTWPSLSEIDGEKKGRRILLEIVNQNIERLDDLIKAHAENADEPSRGPIRAAGRGSITGKPQPAGIQREMPERAIYRGHAACQNYKKSNGKNKEARRTRRVARYQRATDQEHGRSRNGAASGAQ